MDSHGLPESNALIPEQCELESLHWLQRHGARYVSQLPMERVLKLIIGILLHTPKALSL